MGKLGVASMAFAVGNCNREKPAWLTYDASGMVAVSLKTETDTDLLCLVTLTFDILTRK